MTMKISTGLAKGMLDTDCFAGMMTGMKLKIYSGTVPATADASIGSAVLLVTISDAGGAGALQFEASAIGGTIEKASAQSWTGVNVATGTASFCRMELASDTGASSATEVRVQGDVSVAGAFLNLSSVSLTSGATQTVDYLAITLPTA